MYILAKDNLKKCRLTTIIRTLKCRIKNIGAKIWVLL